MESTETEEINKALDHYINKESINVLYECREIQLKKGNDYQNPHSRIKQADYYPRGVESILDIVNAKVLRVRSVIEATANDLKYLPNYESFEDSCKDAINYLSFAVAYSRGKIDGQDIDHYIHPEGSSSSSNKESINVLYECRDIQLKKGNDYQNPHSRIKQADYYPRGVESILDIVNAKVLRMRSVIEAIQHDLNYKPNYESFEDSCKDAINYLSFAVAYSRGKIDGQDIKHDFLNHEIPTNV